MESDEGNNSIPSNIPQEGYAPAVEMTSKGGPEDNDDSLENENLSQSTTKRKRTSDVWNHFTRIMHEGIQHALCNYCNTRLKAPAAHGTTSLHKHYKNTCKKQPRKMDIRQSILSMNNKVGGSGPELAPHIFNQEDCRLTLANMVILHDYPLSIVDHVGFRRYSAKLQPCFTMISRNILESDILKIFHAEKTKCYRLLDKLKCRIAITTDMWTSDNSKKGFMAITAHYIDDSWTLTNFILRFAYVPAPHTAEVMADLLVESFMDWNIDKKLSTITVDNCSTNDAMVRALPNKLPRRHLLLDGQVLHIRCCAHILNLIVKDGLDEIGDSITRIRDSVIYWTGSPSRIEKFEEEAAQQLHVDCSKKLSLDCKTRWNSTYLMLETAIKYRIFFVRVKIREKNYKSLPTDEDWDNALELCGKLKLFYKVTEMFSGTQYPTSNFYFPLICDIKWELNKWLTSPKLVVRKMAEKMVEKYDKYWDECHLIMGVAAVLDPRFKMKLVQFYITLIYGENSSSKLYEIRKSCYDLLIDYQSRALGENLSDTLNLGMEFGISSPTGDDVLDSDTYLDEAVLPRTLQFDILNWWKTNGVKYPYLQKMARDILAIPVSTVASESAFSDSGRLVSPHRNRLNPTTIEALMCSRRWLWNEEKDCSTSVCPVVVDEEDDIREESCLTFEN